MEYNDMFAGYNESLEKTRQNYKQSTNEKLVVEGSQSRDKSLLQSFIKEYNEGDGESGSFLSFLSEKFKSKVSLIAFLKRVKGSITNASLLATIEEMIDSLEDSFDDNAEQKQQKVSAEQEPLKDAVHAKIMATKYQEYSLFAVQKSKNKQHFPTQETYVNTAKFENLSRKELIQNFKADKFYSLSSTQKHALLQAVANEYLTSNGVKPCAVNLVDLPISENSICFGQYNPNTGSININRNLLANLDSADETNNQYLPYQLLSTIIHEARHRVQFSMLNETNLDSKEKAIVNSLMHPQDNMSYSAYLAEPDELDARNEALAYIRQTASTQTDSNSLAQFYNLAKESEMKNSKKDVPYGLKSHFPDIYEERYLPQAKNFNQMREEKKEFNQIIRGRNSSMELAKRFEIKKPY